jgi:putative peptide-modifying radical SAM enzyme
MNYHIILTRQCNLNCIYCHGGEDAGQNSEIQYSLDELERFLKMDDDLQLMMYGGEPTLRIPLITEMIDRFPDARFTLQTNALALNKIPVDYVHKMHSVLVSIDGPREVTDFYRSRGVYDRVLRNVTWLKNQGYAGDIVARMAVSQQSDIYRDVSHLLNLRDPFFDHVHWQLNVVWDAEGNWDDFDYWFSESYSPGLRKLAERWVSKIKTGTIEGIVPFLPLMYSLLTDSNSVLRCGSGLDTFAIHVDGSIGVCPISPDWDFSIVGHITRTSPFELRSIMKVEDPCPTCDIYGLCGGRCLFANKQRLWGEDGFSRICDTVRCLVDALRKVLPQVRRLVGEGVVSVEDFNYPEYNNGCEIIP